MCVTQLIVRLFVVVFFTCVVISGALFDSAASSLLQELQGIHHVDRGATVPCEYTTQISIPSSGQTQGKVESVGGLVGWSALQVNSSIK